MTHIFRFRCNNCDFTSTAEKPETLYVTAENGEIIKCPRGGETEFIADALRLPEKDVRETMHRDAGLFWGLKRRKKHKSITTLLNIKSCKAVKIPLCKSS